MKESKKHILITGATGYIGRRLTTLLLNRDEISLRLLVRNRNKVSPTIDSQVDVVEGDTFDTGTLARAL